MAIEVNFSDPQRTEPLFRSRVLAQRRLEAELLRKLNIWQKALDEQSEKEIVEVKESLPLERLARELALGNLVKVFHYFLGKSFYPLKFEMFFDTSPRNWISESLRAGNSLNVQVLHMGILTIAMANFLNGYEDMELTERIKRLVYSNAKYLFDDPKSYYIALSNFDCKYGLLIRGLILLTTAVKLNVQRDIYWAIDYLRAQLDKLVEENVLEA